MVLMSIESSWTSFYHRENVDLAQILIKLLTYIDII